MNYVLTNCTISGPIERIRGESLITIPVTCTFEVGHQQYTVSGVSNCESASDIANGFLDAVNNAKSNLEGILNIAPQAKTENPKVLTDLVKMSIESTMATELKRRALSRPDYEELMELANEDKQTRVNNLCDALGIDPIQVYKSWTNIEVLVLVEYLEKLTTPLVVSV